MTRLLGGGSGPRLTGRMRSLVGRCTTAPRQLGKILGSGPFCGRLTTACLPGLEGIRCACNCSVFHSLASCRVERLCEGGPGRLAHFRCCHVVAATGAPSRERGCYERTLRLCNGFACTTGRLTMMAVRGSAPSSGVLRPFIDGSTPIRLLSGRTVTLLRRNGCAGTSSILALIPRRTISRSLRTVIRTLTNCCGSTFRGITTADPFGRIIVLLTVGGGRRT